MTAEVYLYFEQSQNVSHPEILLGDLCRIVCSDPKILSRLKQLPVLVLPKNQYGSFVLYTADIQQIIRRKEPDLTLILSGESVFVLFYEKNQTQGVFLSGLKTAFVCILSFFGSAFSIMTFHNDVDLSRLFSQIYTLSTGQPSDGFTILEISYSLGLGLGVLFFFHHLGPLRFSKDPSPMQMEMQQYQSELNEAIIAQDAKQKKPVQ